MPKTSLFLGLLSLASLITFVASDIPIVHNELSENDEWAHFNKDYLICLFFK